MKRRSRVGSLGRPLVAVIAAAAPAAGCGPESAEQSDPQRWSINPPAPSIEDLGCPMTPPQPDAPCNATTPCDYPGDGCAGRPTVHAICENGGFRIEELFSTCNPPTPIDEACPEDVPQAGTPCATVEACDYGNLCNGSRATCEDGLFVVEDTSAACNPPEPDWDAGV